MSNLEVRIRLASEARAMPFAEIPLRLEVIQGVTSLIEDVGFNFGGLSNGETQLSYQLTDDGEKAFLEVIVDDSEK